MPKNGRKVHRTHQQQLAEIVTREGSGRAVAEKLGCSQQSVSAWALGTTLPRSPMQKKLLKVYKIPMPWLPLP